MFISSILSYRFFLQLEQYRNLVRSIVEDGDLYSNDSLRKILKVKKTFLTLWLDVSQVTFSSDVFVAVAFAEAPYCSFMRETMQCEFLSTFSFSLLLMEACKGTQREDGSQRNPLTTKKPK